LDWKIFATVFASVFVAELGDKTQLATMLFASNAETPRRIVFAASASALVLTSAIGVAAGAFVSEYVSERTLRWVAGVGFVAIGLWTLLRS
jgi:putative Ca2+/H+ antiporter (TMEM165/GDT1 family)